MAEHDAAYFVDALRHLDWSHPWTGDQLINLFNDFPIGWFVNVPTDRVFTRWEDFWEYVTPISASTRGPAVHQEMTEEFEREADQRDASGWGK
jgi:hypothetical protein